MSEGPFTILGIAGSLRRASMNRGLLRAAQEMKPDGVDIEVFELHRIPLYNDDENQENPPEVVVTLKEKIRAADALLIASPEYNHSLSGVLKNTIDWASRPPPQSPLRHKPVAIMGVAAGPSGTIRSQLALRVVLGSVESYAMLKPELLIPHGASKFDMDGNLVDQELRERVRHVVESLVGWAQLLRGESSI